MLVIDWILHQRRNHGRILVEIRMLRVDVSRLDSNNVLDLSQSQLHFYFYFRADQPTIALVVGSLRRSNWVTTSTIFS
jgi:hypothetical protein